MVTETSVLQFSNDKLRYFMDCGITIWTKLVAWKALF